jgi:predicted ester cyclase
MPEEYETFLHRWLEEVWHKGREEAIDEMFAEDGVGYGLPTENGEPIRGPQEFKPFVRNFREAFPNMRISIEETVREGDKLAAVCRVTGDLEGESLGVSPAKQPVEFTGIIIVKLRDGKIIEAWNEFNFMQMYQQLGALNLNLK